MAGFDDVRGRTLIAVTVVVAIVLAYAATRAMTHRPRRVAGCGLDDRTIAAYSQRSIDTIGRLRAHAQDVETVVQDSTGVVIWTEDTSRQTVHDGGRVGFDCAGHVRLVWLDGG